MHGHCGSCGSRSRSARAARAAAGCRRRAGNLRTVDDCGEPVWVEAEGTRRWELALAKALPRGRYTLRSRAILANGVARATSRRAIATWCGSACAESLHGLGGRIGRLSRRPRAGLTDARFASMRRATRTCFAAIFLCLCFCAAARADINDPADQWLPSSDGAEWVYAWTNSDYSPPPRTERYVVQSRAGTAFRLRWEEVGAGPFDTPSAGTIDFRNSDAGLVNLNYQSTQPPRAVPDPVRERDLVRQQRRGRDVHADLGHALADAVRAAAAGTRWNSLGGAANDVASSNRYEGREKLTVPAFPNGIEAAKIDLGDHAGGRGRRPVRQRRAHRLVGARRRAGEDHLQARRRRDEPGRAAEHEPRAAGRCRPTSTCCRSTAATARRSAGATTSTCRSGRRSASRSPRSSTRRARVDVDARRRPDQHRRQLHALDAAVRRHAAVGLHARGDARSSSRRSGRAARRAATGAASSRRMT